MVTEIENEFGKIIISKEAIAKIAGLTAMECYGVIGMASRNITEGIVKLLGLDSLTRGIEVSLEEDKLNITLHIIVSYGTNIAVVGESIMNTVKYKVEQLTGITVNEVKLMVEGIRV